jgi:hypothetical protein
MYTVETKNYRYRTLSESIPVHCLYWSVLIHVIVDAASINAKGKRQKHRVLIPTPLSRRRECR